MEEEREERGRDTNVVDGMLLRYPRFVDVLQSVQGFRLFVLYDADLQSDVRTRDREVRERAKGGKREIRRILRVASGESRREGTRERESEGSN